jgi:hypothetical protein
MPVKNDAPKDVLIIRRKMETCRIAAERRHEIIRDKE